MLWFVPQLFVYRISDWKPLFALTENALIAPPAIAPRLIPGDTDDANFKLDGRTIVASRPVARRLCHDGWRRRLVVGVRGALRAGQHPLRHRRRHRAK